MDFNKIKESVKNYLKKKWSIAKPILVKKGKEMLDLIKNKVKLVKDFLIFHGKDLLKKLWNKVKETYHDIRNKVLAKEIELITLVADFLWERAEDVMDKLKERLGIEDDIEEDIIEDSIPEGDIIE